MTFTLQPGEKVFASLDSLVSLEEGIVAQPQILGDWFVALLRYYFGGISPWLQVYHNSTDTARQVVLGCDLPGDILRLDVNKSPFCVNPQNLVAYTSGIRQGTQWLGWSSWLAGEGLLGLKLSGKGRVFLSGVGRLSQQTVHQRFGLEQGHFVAYSTKLKLKLNFPKGLVGSPRAGEGFIHQLLGGGILYFQSSSLTNLIRFLRTKITG
jgi:uncharacterized protein (TIGR00266 family)